MTRAERAKMTRKNRAYLIRRKMLTWKNIQGAITSRVQDGESNISVLIKLIPYEFIRILHAEGYRMYPDPNAKGQIIVEWEF